MNLHASYDFVFIVDLLSDTERNSSKISSDLMKLLAQNKVNQLLSMCDNKSMLESTLQYMKKVAALPLSFPVHIVGHGDSDGLSIGSSSETIDWGELRDHFFELNSKLDGKLFLNMTSCKGINAIKVVNENETKLPFYGVVGCKDDLEKSDAININRMFYTGLFNGEDISKIVPQINSNFGKHILDCITSSGFQDLENA